MSRGAPSWRSVARATVAWTCVSTATGRPSVIDVNPNNDIHPDAGLAAAARSVGLAYPELIARVVECAIEQAARRAVPRLSQLFARAPEGALRPGSRAKP